MRRLASAVTSTQHIVRPEQHLGLSTLTSPTQNAFAVAVTFLGLNQEKASTEYLRDSGLDRAESQSAELLRV